MSEQDVLILDIEDPDITVLMLDGEKPRHVIAVLHPNVGHAELTAFHAFCNAIAQKGIGKVTQLSERQVEVDGEVIDLDESMLLLALTYSGDEARLLNLDLFRSNPKGVTYH